jgi:5-methylcytosine-specific restriction endonuclease McrA
MRRSKYTKELLAPIVASSQSLSEVIRKLGLEANGGNHRHISGRIRLAGLDTSHFGGAYRTRIERMPVDQLTTLVAGSKSYANVLAQLGLPTMGRAFFELEKRVAALELDTSHFRGQGWSRGETKTSHPSVARLVAQRAIPIDDVLVENAPLVKRTRLVELLTSLGRVYRCAICGIDKWCGKKLVLHLDHINGINNDNRLTNLRFLCPNCHSQTPTYCRRPTKGTTASEPRCLYACYTSPARERGAIWYPR